MVRKRFEMTTEDHAKLIEASRPVPYMVIGGCEPRSPQENANAAWESLGRRMGFDYMTVEPIPGESQMAFTAEPTATSELELTEDEKHEGWHIAHCGGNAHVPGCGKPYKRLNWHTPSGCRHCNATFVD